MNQVSQMGRRTISLAQILGLGEDVRVQNPDLQKTSGKNPRWYIRPYIDTLNHETGAIEAKQERIYLGVCAETPKREAIRLKNEVMAKINRRQYVVQAQIPFGDLLDTYLREYVQAPQNLSSSTRAKYESHIKNHIRPAFGELRLAEINTQRIDAMLSAKARAGMAHATRLDLRNLLCGIFTKATAWGYWKEANPAILATAGKEKPVREHKKLSIEDTQRLLAALPEDVGLIVQVSLFCTLRISEVLGLMWKHVDFERNVLLIRQRWYRGDLDEVKTKKSKRDVSMGYLSQTLASRYPGNGHDDEYVFSVRTHVGDWKNPGVCRDDRDILQHFLRPTAKALGIHTEGFGFHSFRREAITHLGAMLGGAQAQRMAGHSKADMTMHYTLEDHRAQDEAVRKLQERLLGDSVGGVQ